MIIGKVVRPSTGETVEWRLAQPIEDLVEQGKRHGFRNLGTIGDRDHLLKHGDHTPWSRGKKRGIVYGKDTDMPSDFEQFLLICCRDPDYDTRFVDFFNINGRQYNNAGQLVATSSDGHFHLSIAVGFENAHVTLFDDYVKWKEGDDMPTPKEVIGELMNTKLDSPTHKIKGRTFADWIKQVADIEAEQKVMNAKLDEIIRLLKSPA